MATTRTCRVGSLLVTANSFFSAFAISCIITITVVTSIVPSSGADRNDPPPPSSVVSVPNICPSTCRCLNGGSVVFCYDVVHIPPVPSAVVLLDLDHNRISLLQNSSLRGAISTSGSAGSWTTLRRLETLRLEDNGLLFIESGALATLYELRVLRLGRNHLSSLPRDLFAANRKLQVLDLHANYLATVPDDVVRHVHSLRVLNVSYNHLTSARLGDNFRFTSLLSVIDFSGNDIATVESDAFDVMQWWDESLARHVNLSYCNIRHIRPAAFRPIPRPTSLVLDGNPRLPQDQLESALGGIRHQSHLDVIRLSHGNITDPATLVRQLQSATNLTRLDLRHNRIRVIGGRRTFFFLSSLRRLDLAHNEIVSVDSLEGLSRLEHLDLSFNSLERLEQSTFEGLHELRILDVSHNSLVGNFDSEPFLGLFNLHTIDVGHNRIRSFNIEDGLESLERFLAPWNRVTDLSFVRHLPRLKTLDLSHNAVERVGDDIFPSRGSGGHTGSDGVSEGEGKSTVMMNMHSLNLSGNSIVEISPTAFRYSSFGVVDLSFNRLTTLANFGWSSGSSGGRSLAGVRSLIVSDNYIANVTDNAFDGLESSLVELHAERNLIWRLPVVAIERLRRLRLLNVGWNPVGQFLETFGKEDRSASGRSGGGGSLAHIETLRLNDVGLTSWPSSRLFALPPQSVAATRRRMSNQTNNLSVASSSSSSETESVLRNLNLSGNRIRSVPDKALSQLTELDYLDLSRNNLVAFDPELVTVPSRSAFFLDLSDNPIDCTCAAASLCRHLFPQQTTSQALPETFDADQHHRRRTQHRNRNNLSGGNSSWTGLYDAVRCRTPTEWNSVPLAEFCADVVSVQCSRFVTTAAAIGVGFFAFFAVLLFIGVVICRRLRRRRCGSRLLSGVSGSPPSICNGKTSAVVYGNARKAAEAAAAAAAGSASNSSRSKSRTDCYEFVVDETTLTSGSNASSASSNTTTTSSGLCSGSGSKVPLHTPTLKPSSKAGNATTTLQANLLLSKQWI